MDAAKDEASGAETEHEKTRVETQTASPYHFLDVVRYVATVHGDCLFTLRQSLRSHRAKV